MTARSSSPTGLSKSPRATSRSPASAAVPARAAAASFRRRSASFFPASAFSAFVLIGVVLHVISSLSFFTPWYTFARAASSEIPSRLGDVGVAPIEHVPMDHGHALLRRQARHGRPQIAVELRLPARRGRPLRQLVGRDRPAAGGPMVVDRLPRGDPQDPPVEPRGIREPRIRPERRHERVLEAVVGLVRTDGRHQEPIDGSPVLLQEFVERRELHDLRCNHTPNNDRAVSA